MLGEEQVGVGGGEARWMRIYCASSVHSHCEELL